MACGGGGQQQRQQQEQRRWRACIAYLPLLLFLLALLHGAGPAAAQQPEPNCNSNRYEGNEVWSAVPNSIGQGPGEFWWGVKALPGQWPPVSWIDMCAQRLEACQADEQIPGSMSGYKPNCVCDMWSCLHRQPPPETAAAAAASSARPACHFVGPQLLNFYCEAARYINTTCSDPAYVPLPPDGQCPPLPAEGFSFDDMPGDGIRIPRGYQGLLWHNMYMLDGDNYLVQCGFYAGVISSPKVAFNGYGYPASFSSPDGGLLTLHSLWATSAWEQDNVVTFTASNEQGSTVGTLSVPLATDEPRLVDFAALLGSTGTSRTGKGSFAGVKSVSISTTGTQVVLDNLHVTVQAEPGREIVLPSLHDLEFYPAPPGASAPIRKKHPASPLDDGMSEGAALLPSMVDGGGGGDRLLLHTGKHDDDVATAP